MSEKMRESLSALMDGEANEIELQRVIAQIGNDQELREVWARYHVVRTAAAGQEASHLSLDISTRVREAIADDEAGGGSRFARVFRPVASLAVAASVAAVVVLGGQQISQIGTVDGYDNPAVVAGAAPVGLVNSLGATSVQASYGTQNIPVLQPAERQAYKELARQRMQMYLEEHAEHAALNSPQGLVSYARIKNIKE